MNDRIAGLATIDQGQGFRIENFGPEAWPLALVHLLESYPQSSAAWWQAGFDRTRQVPVNRPDHPIGTFLKGPQGNTVGVAMFYASERPVADGASPRLHVNVASWAMSPKVRERAMWFARRGLDRPEAVYTALTPITATAGILRRLKFEPVSQQLVLCFTPKLSRLAGQGARVIDAKATLAELKDDPMQPLLDDHRRLGCLVCAVETPAGWLPLVLRKRRRALGVPVAEMIYTPSTAAVARAVGPLSRFLLRQGFPLMEFEADAYQPIEFGATRLFRLRLARGAYPRQGIDHLYSELVYLHR